VYCFDTLTSSRAVQGLLCGKTRFHLITYIRISSAVVFSLFRRTATWRRQAPGLTTEPVRPHPSPAARLRARSRFYLVALCRRTDAVR